MKKKTIRPELSERNQKAREKWKQEQAERRAKGQDGDSISAAEAARLIDALDESDAKDAGMSVSEWRARSEIERTRLWEDFTDTQFAGEMPLETYRQEKRRAFEAHELRDNFGPPSWLRLEYARENPQKVAKEYARLIFHGMSASGELLAQTIAAIEWRTMRGWLGTGLGFAELKARVEEEVDRLGLREEFDRVLAWLAENFSERTIQ